jgi:hypothetical protein
MSFIVSEIKVAFATREASVMSSTTSSNCKSPLHVGYSASSFESIRDALLATNHGEQVRHYPNRDCGRYSRLSSRKIDLHALAATCKPDTQLS